MTEKKHIIITIQGGGISFERQIDEDQAGKIIAFCLQPAKGNGTKSGALSAVGQVDKPSDESAAEYLLRHAPKRNPDKILVLAGYLRDIVSKSSFHPQEIKTLFRDAGELQPANFNRDFRWVQNTGWIAPDQSKKGAFYITNTGLKVLRKGFPKELVDRSKNRATTDRRRKKQSKKRTETK